MTAMGFKDYFSKKTKKGQRNEELPHEHSDFPTSSNPQGLCPRCNKQSSFEYIGELPATFGTATTISHGQNTKDYYDKVSSLVCRNCNQPTIVIEERLMGDSNDPSEFTGGAITWNGLFWWPFHNLEKTESIPSHIQSTLNESRTTHAVKCYRSAAVMARRTLEAIAHDKGESNGTLATKLNSLTERKILDSTLSEWAKEVRLIGNSGAHFDSIDEVSEDDSNQIIVFIEELIKYIYIMPAELEKRRKKAK
ncbi:MAG: DUF4145 domain-containing protein [Cyclobacteriaceae bacterium]